MTRPPASLVWLMRCAVSAESARQLVNQRRFVRPIRPDDRVNLARAKLKVAMVGHAQIAKLLAEVVGFEN